MKIQTFVLASTLCVVGLGPATAGPCTTEIDAVAKTLAARDAGSGPTGSAGTGMQSAPASGTQHPPTSIMKQQTEGKAASPEDVRRQTAGQPPAAQQGTSGTAAKTDAPMQASSALERARGLDRQRKEAECMEAVREAKQLAGSR